MRQVLYIDFDRNLLPDFLKEFSALSAFQRIIRKQRNVMGTGWNKLCPTRRLQLSETHSELLSSISISNVQAHAII